MKSRIMYIERKDDGLDGPARIGRVTFSRSFKANYFEVATRTGYWISGCKKRGGDRLYPGLIEIDPDVLEEYWVEIRKLPDRKDQKLIRCKGKYGGA
jgi:hypothetical protein